MKNKEKRTEFIIVRVTKNEKESLKKQGGYAFSKFIRKQLGLNEKDSNKRTCAF